MLTLAQLPARIRVSSGRGDESRQETFQQVLMDLESQGSVLVTAQQLLGFLGNPSNVSFPTEAGAPPSKPPTPEVQQQGFQ
jgi:hypothetical protein